MEIVQRYAVEIILNLASFAISLVFGIICFVYFPDGAAAGDKNATTTAAYTALIVGVLTNFALTNWLLAMKAAIDIAENREITKGNDQRLKTTLDESKIFRDQLLDRLQSYENTIAPEYKNLDRLWAGVYGPVRNAGRASHKDYTQKFQTNDHGYEVYGEDWSLSAYSRVWERLVEEQKQLQSHGNKDMLIARVTHSNDIDIWNANGAGRSRAEGLLSLQRDFIRHGGVIVRLLLYRASDSLDKYHHVKDAMESIGIETRLCELDSTDDAPFDFLWATSNEASENQHCVVKWYPVAGGLRLAKCEITDLADEDVRRIWRHFAIRSENIEGNFESIPHDRQTS
jgi:hypothetical protein